MFWKFSNQNGKGVPKLKIREVLCFKSKKRKEDKMEPLGIPGSNKTLLKKWIKRYEGKELYGSQMPAKVEIENLTP